MIHFNKAYKVYKLDIDFTKISGDGKFTDFCQYFFEKKFKAAKTLLTTSCTDALEMSAILLNIKSGDEIIAPSYTFVSTVNAFVLRGAKIVFVDIRPDTMNIDEKLIEQAITKKTKAIIPVHYAGVACEMDTILDIAKRHNLYVVEDAAQGVMAKYKGLYLGTLGDLGTYSFHETKNYTMGEGGAIVINNLDFISRAEIIREKGTNRSSFLRGQIDKYTWVDIGSSFLPSDINAAYLYPQLEKAEEINSNRIDNWNYYYNKLKEMTHIELPHLPPDCEHNAHMFYIKCKDLVDRNNLINYLSTKDIQAVSHYVPLHSSPEGKKRGRFHGKDKYTTIESERLLRLPLYYGMSKEDIELVCQEIIKYYS